MELRFVADTLSFLGCCACPGLQWLSERMEGLGAGGEAGPWGGHHHHRLLPGSHPPPPGDGRRGCDRELTLPMFGFRFLETALLSNLISLLHTLWVTTLGNRDVQAGAQPPCRPGSQEPPKLLALHLVDEFLYVLLVLTKHLR